MADDMPRADEVTNLTPQEVAEGLRAGRMLLVDVREPNETAAGFVRGAELMPYTSGVFARDHGKIAKDPPVLVYCASGARARRAAELLVAEGWKDVIVLSGGGYEDLRSLPAR